MFGSPLEQFGESTAASACDAEWPRAFCGSVVVARWSCVLSGSPRAPTRPRRSSTRSSRAIGPPFGRCCRRRPTSTPPKPTARPRCTGPCAADDVEMARAAARRRRRCAAANRYGVTPLQLAAVNGSAAADHGAPRRPAPIANAVLPEGETVLMTAARTGRADAADGCSLDGGARSRRAREAGSARRRSSGRRPRIMPTPSQLLVRRGADVNGRSATLDLSSAASRTVGAAARQLDAADVRRARERARRRHGR